MNGKGCDFLLPLLIYIHPKTRIDLIDRQKILIIPIQLHFVPNNLFYRHKKNYILLRKICISRQINVMTLHVHDSRWTDLSQLCRKRYAHIMMSNIDCMRTWCLPATTGWLWLFIARCASPSSFHQERATNTNQIQISKALASFQGITNRTTTIWRR